MAHVLYIEASPRKLRSASIEVAQAVLSAWRKADPKLTVDTLDVWSTKLPEFDGPVMEAKYAGLAGTPLTKEQESAWSSLSELAKRFTAADALLFAVPLWNFGIPYKLKHLIDLVTQKDLLFTFDGQAFGGMLNGRKAVLIYARGLDYGPGGLPPDVYDFQKPYLETWLRFVGITEFETIIVQKTLFGPEVDSASRAEAVKEAEELGRRCAGLVSA